MSSATLPLLEDDTVAFGDDLETENQKNQLPHPYVSFFHIGVRAASIIAYLFCPLFTNSFITSFVTIVLLLSVDFWCVKNITGRIMVGLRWWNYVDDDGKSHWVFESRKGPSQNRTSDRESFMFWTALIATPLIWLGLFVGVIFTWSLKWLLLIIIAIILTGANLYGYVKCKMGSNQSIATLVTSDFINRSLTRGLDLIVSKEARPPQSNPISRPSNTV